MPSRKRKREVKPKDINRRRKRRRRNSPKQRDQIRNAGLGVENAHTTIRSGGTVQPLPSNKRSRKRKKAKRKAPAKKNRKKKKKKKLNPSFEKWKRDLSEGKNRFVRKKRKRSREYREFKKCHAALSSRARMVLKSRDAEDTDSISPLVQSLLDFSNTVMAHVVKVEESHQCFLELFQL